MIKKLIISSILVITLLFSFSTFAFADAIGGAGLLSGGLSAIGIDLLAGGSATVATLAPWLNDNFSLIGALTGVADGFLKIGDSSVFIDGKEFESVFLDPNFALTLHTKIFDFKTQYGIVSNSSGIFATGYGFADGVEIYQSGNDLNSTKYHFKAEGTYQIGNTVTTIAENTQSSKRITITLSNGTSSNNTTTNSTLNNNDTYFSIDGVKQGDNVTLTAGFRYYSNSLHNIVTRSIPTTLIEYDPFDYSYVAGDINTDPLPADYGFQVFVPVEDLEDAGYNPGTYINVGSGTDDIIGIIQLLDEIFANEEILNPEFTDVVDPPSPTPTPIPVPTDALGNVPYPDFLDTFGQSIYDRLDNIDDTVDTIGQSITDELEYQSSIFDTIGLAIDSIEDAVTDVVDGIQVKVGEIADTLVDIKDGILDAIEESTIELIDSGIDVLRSIFGPILQTIRSHVGIWHYVVSWIQSISTPFTWILGIANGTSYYMVLPLYALVAGTLVIAIYKRFGR